MYVVSLIGRYADEASAFLMPKDAAESAIQFGTHRRATEEEVLKAGFVMDASPAEASPDQLPAGYKLKIDNGGYALFFTDAEGNETEFGFYGNSAAARSAANDFAEKAAAQVTTKTPKLSKAEAAAAKKAEEEAELARLVAGETGHTELV